MTETHIVAAAAAAAAPIVESNKPIGKSTLLKEQIIAELKSKYNDQVSESNHVLQNIIADLDGLKNTLKKSGHDNNLNQRQAKNEINTDPPTIGDILKEELGDNSG